MDDCEVMSVNSFRLQGIKGFTDTGEIELRPITLFIGQNSSGKSAIVRFPLVLKQTFLDDSMAPILFYGKSIDYGNYEDVVFKHDKSRPIEFSFTVSGEQVRDYGRYRFLEEMPIKELISGHLRINVRIRYRENDIMVDHFSICAVDGNQVITSMDRSSDDAYSIRLNSGNGTFETLPIPADRGRLGFDKFLPDFRMIRLVRELRLLHEGHFALLSAISAWFNVFVNNVHYIGPFRRTPERTHRYKENSVTYVGSDGEFAPVVLGQDRRTGSNLIRKVSSWLKENLDFELEVDDLRGEMFRIMVKDQTTKARNNLIDVGYGLSQLIPIIVQTFMLRQGRKRQSSLFSDIHELNIIEQPELHLHPSAQAALADLFVAGVTAGKSFLIETHSEHMLIRLRRYIVEGVLKPEDVALYYTEKQPDDGSIKVKRLTITELGDIPEWPKGFFSEDFAEYMRLRQVRQQKQPQEDSPLW